jgi:hypothetical protein
MKGTDYKSFSLNNFTTLLYFLCLGYKYSPQHHIFRVPSSVTADDGGRVNIKREHNLVKF